MTRPKIMNEKPKTPELKQSLPPLLTSREVAEILQVSTRKLAEMKADGLIPFVQVGRSIRFAKGDVESWIHEHRVGR